MSTRGRWPHGADPWLVWNRRPKPPVVVPEQRAPVEADSTASLAGFVLSGHQPTDEEARSLAASVLSSRARG